jgi:hypothetical protein
MSMEPNEVPTIDPQCIAASRAIANRFPCRGVGVWKYDDLVGGPEETQSLSAKLL